MAQDYTKIYTIVQSIIQSYKNKSGGIFITNLSIFCQTIYPYKINVPSQPKFVDLMLKSVAPTSLYTKSTLEAFYYGRRPFADRTLITLPFRRNHAVSFFNNYLKQEKVDKLLEAFGITAVSRNNFTFLTNAMAYYLEDLLLKDDDAITTSVKHYYLQLLSDDTFYLNNHIEPSDYEYIAEVHRKCPICTSRLTEIVDNRRVRNFKITMIYPSTLNPAEKILFDGVKKRVGSPTAYINNIALCPRCSQNYVEQKDLATYKFLLEAKKKAVERKEIDDALEDFDLDKKIEEVLDLLVQIDDRGSLPKLSLDAVSINHKIPENDLCYEDVKNRAITYYHFIDSYLSKYEAQTSTGSTKLGEQIKAMSIDLMARDLPPSDVVETLAQELNRRFGGNNQTLIASHFIVAYFVQHCEVLSHETT